MNRIILACYERLIFVYPRSFRAHYGRELLLFMRDYARDHHALSVGLFLFTDLLISLPREYVKEIHMGINRRTLAGAVGGVFLIAMAVMMVVQDIQNPDDRMGFFATLVVCTIGLAGAVLLMLPLRPGARFLWLIPATYAAAGATWVMITPFVMASAPGGWLSVLFRLGSFGALGLLFLPVVIALLPVMKSQSKTIATVLLGVFALLFSFLLGAYYVPAAIAMALVHIAHAPPARIQATT